MALSPGAASQTVLNQTPAAAGQVTTPKAAQSAGSQRVGSASYPVPAQALYVSTTGDDTADGSQGSPLRTIAAAVGRAGNGTTIVVRAGSYHESLVLPAGKALTIENMPGEAVWLDGASTVGGFTQQGNTWVRAGWNTTFDSSPTFRRGASDGPAPYWQFVNPAHPMAAHPDQVWVGRRELTQVASESQVDANSFFVDQANHRLVIGADPGAGVRASTLGKAVTFLGDGSTLRGVGVWGYADSVPDMGAVVAYARNITLENDMVLGSATTGVGIYRSGATLRHVTINDSGLMGLHGTQADNLLMDGVRITGSNTEQFNPTPAAGGIKLSTSRTVTLQNSVVSGTTGNGVWTDDSTYDIAVVDNAITDNTGRGVFLELSQKAVVVGNLIARSGDDQVRVGNTAQAQIWGNTITGTTVAVHVCQDSRTPASAGYAVDPRRPSPDPDMTWTITGTTLGDNVLQASGSASALVLVEDYTTSRSGDDLVSQIDGNAYAQPVVGQPAWVVGWARAGADPSVHTTLAAFRAATAHEQHGWSETGATVVSDDGTLDASVPGSTGVTMPGDVAARAGVASSQRLGAA